MSTTFLLLHLKEKKKKTNCTINLTLRDFSQVSTKKKINLNCILQQLSRSLISISLVLFLYVSRSNDSTCVESKKKLRGPYLKCLACRKDSFSACLSNYAKTKRNFKDAKRRKYFVIELWRKRQCYNVWWSMTWRFVKPAVGNLRKSCKVSESSWDD